MERKYFKFVLIVVMIFSTSFFINSINLADKPFKNLATKESKINETDIPESPLSSAWVANGTPVCTESHAQFRTEICSDDAGGAIIVWEDTRTGQNNRSVYVQRVDSAGNLKWTPTDGVPICTNTSLFTVPLAICKDGAGGAIILWQDNRTGTGRIDFYAQRIDSDGIPQWTDQGEPIITHDPSAIIGIKMISDGNNGAILAWSQNIGVGDYNIFAQKINANGVPTWSAHSAGGLPICVEVENQHAPDLCTDGAGGAIISWADNRFSSDYDNVYAQRVSSAGYTQWILNGEDICTVANNWDEAHPIICSDDAGGAIIAWLDNRTGVTSWDYDEIYAQRINGNGHPYWADQGVPICKAIDSRWDPFTDDICSDGANGAIIVWNNLSASGTDRNVHAQKVNSQGIVQWGTNGKDICTENGDQWTATVCTDGAGGAIITWRDDRIDDDIYAQHINSKGNPQCTVNGTIICNADNSQRYPQIIYSGAGTAIISWMDARSGTNDVYANRFEFTVGTTGGGGGDDDDDDDDDDRAATIPGYDLYLIIAMIGMSAIVLYFTKKRKLI